MKLKEVTSLLNGKVLCGEDMLDQEVVFGFASDLMSDVLTIESDKMILITGLTNLQAIRTAEMSDISTILFVRNKPVSEEMVTLARENDMVLLECTCSMFKAAGILFEAGIKPIF